MLPPPPEGLRHWRPADAPALAAAWDDPEIARWNEPPAAPAQGSRLDQASRWIARAEARWRSTGAVDLVVPDPQGDDDAVAGEVALRNRTTGPARAELSVWLLPPARGRGLAPAAVRAARDWAFDALGIEQCWARVHRDNGAGLALFDRLGWDRLGTSGDNVIVARTRPVLR